MKKIIGMILILSSLISLALGSFIDWKYGGGAQVTGKVVLPVVKSPVSMSFFSYLEATALAYSIISFIMGVVFLFRM